MAIDKDTFNACKAYHNAHGTAPDLDGLGTSTNTSTDNDLFITKESGGTAWVKKSMNKLWLYLKNKLGMGSSTTTFLRNDGQWATPTAQAFSYVGMIIHSTTLATLEDVQNVYGSDTTWIQHSGYMLRGASSGVTAEQAQNDGGADSVSYTPKGTNSGGSVSNHKLTADELPTIKFRIPHVQYYDSCALQNISETHSDMSWEGQARSINNNGWHVMSIGGNSGHNHGFTQPTFTGTAKNINTLPSYKNVYIWERTQ